MKKIRSLLKKHGETHASVFAVEPLPEGEDKRGNIGCNRYAIATDGETYLMQWVRFGDIFPPNDTSRWRGSLVNVWVTPGVDLKELEEHLDWMV